MSKVVATYTGRFDVYQKLSNIKIQIISVPKQKNKIVMTGQPTLIPGYPKDINGSLLSVKKLMPNDYVNMYRVIISFQNRGSHQGGTMHNFKDNIALFSKDEKQIDKLLKFLEKHITKKKVRRTSKKSKKGGCGKGGGKGSVSKKNKYISKLSLNAVNTDFYNDLEILAPFGSGNTRPIFLIENVKIIKPQILKDKYISFFVKSKYGKMIQGFSFNILESAINSTLLNDKNQLNLIVQLKQNTWKNKKKLQLILLDIIDLSNKA